eukprot:CAMPEP_0197547956 /NCGR_PEP_ID=MMETSP1320-20131121/2181_1 /TAXON_ID=91990 /ORGANISM="Bolidomonas sp., Strain RCC2347" /LENGTH=1108 /DNA_ID=CAMNT_0043107859 /DNA_START=52 /DNA_END=3375 /DNA_ORIENTATION=+
MDDKDDDPNDALSPLPDLGPPPAPNKQELRRASAPAAYSRPDGGGLGAPAPEQPTESSCSIQVFCRFRPSKASISKDILTLSKPEECPFSIDDEGGVIKANVDGTFADGGRQFHFDKVFKPECTQGDVYAAVEHIVTGVMMGFNGTIMSYGQTSSGKTHTMEGKLIGFVEDPNEEVRAKKNEPRGICPRAIDTLFRCIEDADEDMEFTLKLSYVEIYCEKIRDLLEPMSNNLKIKEMPSGELVLSGVTEVYVTDQDGVFGVMQQGKGNRATAPTLMNAESSRSHSLLMMTVTQRDVKTERVMRARLVLGDLAGSERIKKTKVSGVRLDEAKKINQSLSTLGMVINSLSDGSTHVPYRDSKLTRVLQESLGGNSRTALLVCCAPERVHASETISTLRFGERASRIRNVIVRNEELSVKELQALLADANAEIDRLQMVIKRLESGSGPAPSGGGSGPPLTKSSTSKEVLAAFTLVNDDAFTKNLLDEVDRMGVEGEGDLLGEEDVDISEPLKMQLDVLKTELKKQRLMQIHSFRHQRSLEEDLEAAQERGRTLTEALTIAQSNSKSRTEDSDDNDTVTTVETELSALDLRERLAELENVNAQLSAEREEHAQARATVLALQDALTSMAQQHVLGEKDAEREERSQRDGVTMTEDLAGPDLRDVGVGGAYDEDDEVEADDSIAEDVYARVVGKSGEVPSPLLNRMSQGDGEGEDDVDAEHDEDAIDNAIEDDEDDANVDGGDEDFGPELEPEKVLQDISVQTNAILVEDLVDGPVPDFDRIDSMEREIMATEKEKLALEAANMELRERSEELEGENGVLNEENEGLRGESDGLRDDLERLRISHEEKVEELNSQIASLNDQIAALKQAEHHNKLNVENLASQLPPNQLNNLKNLTGELQTMIDDEIEQLEQELQEAEGSAAKANKELEAVREELVKEKRVAFETESELRKELASCRKQIETLTDREERALESVEKRRSSRGNFWSPTRRLSELSAGTGAPSEGRMSSGGGRDPASGPDVPETVESLRAELDLLETQYHSNLDAHALVLETKEEVLRSLLKQNASLTMDRSGLQREREILLRRVEELSEAIRAMQKAQNLLTAAGGMTGTGG